MLSAKKMSKALQQVGIKVVNYEESKDPKFMDGEVALENSLNVQLGFDYACLCLVKEDGIDYLISAMTSWTLFSATTSWTKVL